MSFTTVCGNSPHNIDSESNANSGGVGEEPTTDLLMLIRKLFKLAESALAVAFLFADSSVLSPRDEEDEDDGKKFGRGLENEANGEDSSLLDELLILVAAKLGIVGSVTLGNDVREARLSIE